MNHGSPYLAYRWAFVFQHVVGDTMRLGIVPPHEIHGLVLRVPTFGLTL